MTAGSRLDKRGEDMVKYEGDKLLFIFLLTFLSAAREKLQKSAAKGRTYGSPLDSNSLVTLAVPR